MEKVQQGQKVYQVPFVTPKKEDDDQKSLIVGILDASSSMRTQWGNVAKCQNKLKVQSKTYEFYTIAFSNETKLIKGDIKQDISEYGNKSTNIIAGFRMMESIILNQKYVKDLTIIFISDGKDSIADTISLRIKTELSDLQDKVGTLNFICIGIGLKFPKFIAMDLRQMYHTGSQYIPACFLINTLDKYVQTFEEISEVLQKSQKVLIEPPVKIIPWHNPVNQVHEGSWILTESNIILINGVEYEVLDQVTLHNLENIFSGWIQTLQLSTLKTQINKEELAKNSGICLQIILQLREKLNYKIKQQLFKDNDISKLTFMQRLKFSRAKEDQVNLDILIKEVKRVQQGDILQTLTEQQAAKRLAIGTKIGRFHQNALKMRSLSVSEFLIKLIKLEYSVLEPSVILLQTQKGVFLEPDFIDGLNLCQSQYELVEALPVIGLGLLVKRTNASMVNPWYIHQNIIKYVIVCIQSKNNLLKLKIGANQEEQINCVLPLIQENDKDLKPYLTQKLYNILMTFNVMQNADTLFMNAYTALLASTLYYVLGLANSQWKNEILLQIHTTIRILYSNNKIFQDYITQIVNKSFLAIVVEHPIIQTKCEDICKAVMGLNYIIQEKLVQNQEKIKEFLHRIFIEFFGRAYPQQTPIEQFFKLENIDELQKIDFKKEIESIQEKYKNPFQLRFCTSQDIKNQLLNDIKKNQNNINSEIHVSTNFKLFYGYDLKNNLNQLESIYTYYTNEEIDKSVHVAYIYHASEYTNSFLRNTNEIYMDTENILSRIKGKLLSQYFEAKRKIEFEQLWQESMKNINQNLQEII